MNLLDMITVVRRDLHDEDNNVYRWTDDELGRHIAHAIADLSEACPLEKKINIATVNGSNEINISTIADLIIVEAVEYPCGQTPQTYRRFSSWAGVITLLDPIVPDGSSASVYYGALHTTDNSTCSVPSRLWDLVVGGACGFAAVEWSAYATNRVNTGGEAAGVKLGKWGNEKLTFFRKELKRLHRNNRVRVRSLYIPVDIPANKTTDFGC